MMDVDKLKTVFRETFDLPDDVDWSNLRYSEYPTWTSLGHMSLVAAIGNAFDIMFETDDIIDMSSFDKAVELTAKHVG
jgi:acyl carrier protein